MSDIGRIGFIGFGNMAKALAEGDVSEHYLLAQSTG